MHDGRITEAHEVARAVDGLDEYYGTYALAVRGELAVLRDENVEAELAITEVAAAESDWASACLAGARGRLHDDETELRDALEQFDRIGARFEWACTAVLLPDVADRGHRAFAELGCGSPAGSPTSVD